MYIRNNIVNFEFNINMTRHFNFRFTHTCTYICNWIRALPLPINSHLHSHLHLHVPLHFQLHVRLPRKLHFTILHLRWHFHLHVRLNSHVRGNVNIHARLRLRTCAFYFHVHLRLHYSFPLALTVSNIALRYMVLISVHYINCTTQHNFRTNGNRLRCIISHHTEPHYITLHCITCRYACYVKIHCNILKT